MKILLLIVLISVLSPLFVSFSYAQTLTPATTRQQRLDARSIDLKARGDAEITRRITALNALITKVNAFKKLSNSQKLTFTANIEAQITALTTLKTKIDSDTDVMTLKADVQSIVTSYRIFALYLPQINILAFADRLLVTTDTLTDLSTKLQARIQEAKTSGHDVTNLTTTLTDMQNKITDAKTQAYTVITTITPLTPAGYPGNKTTLQSVRYMLTTALTDIEGKTGTNGVKQDTQLTIQGLKLFRMTSTPSPTKSI